MDQPERNSGYGLASASAAGGFAASVLACRPPGPRAYRPGIALLGCSCISEYHLRA